MGDLMLCCEEEEQFAYNNDVKCESDDCGYTISGCLSSADDSENETKLKEKIENNIEKFKIEVNHILIDKLEDSDIIIPPGGKVNREVCGERTISDDKTKLDNNDAGEMNKDGFTFDSIHDKSIFIRNKTISLIKRKCRSSDKKHTCNACGRAFSKFSKLKSHCRLHTGEKPFKCEICGTSFTQKSSMKYHMRSHDTTLKPLVCPLCQKTFVTKWTLSKHIKRHSGEKTCECSICHKQFFENHSLMIHLRTHTKEKPFSCNICGKSFAQNGYLRLHHRVHTGEKPYQCTMCEKTFVTPTKRKVHMRTHTLERKYNCKECGKTFVYAHSLKYHMAVHERNVSSRPFVCKICHKGFTTPAGLRYHETIHGIGSKHSCDYCGRLYCLRSSLRKHIKKVHKDDHLNILVDNSKIII